MDKLVMVVDDQLENLKVIGNLLKENGYGIALAKSGDEAFQVLECIEPDLILLDVMMPGMDGFEVCRRLKKEDRTRDIPVIFLTARTAVTDVIEGFNTGAVDYIGKPFNASELLIRVNTHIELRLARKEISRQAESLRTLNREKDRIFSIISHDALSPVSSMQMLLDTLVDCPDTAGTLNLPEALQLIRLSTIETRNLLENLLHWARSQMGKSQRVPVYFNMNEVVQRIFRLYRQAASQKGVSLESDMTGEITVFADEEMTRIVLRNLVGNALKFSPAGTCIRVKSARVNHGWEIAVSDQGKGMDSATLSRLFDEQDYFSSPGTQGERGTGLGLKICQYFVRLNQGSIRAESNPGQGSRFYFTLPDRMAN